MVHREFVNQPLDEVLEEIWCHRERDSKTVSGLAEASKEANVTDVLHKLAEQGLVHLDGDTVLLEPEGEKRAEKVVRRHRLAERLLTDLFELEPLEWERTACLMEHILSPVVTDAVCTFLGHPPTCPHGRVIPRGDCCRQKNGKIEPVVVRLHDLAPGQRARITLIAPTVQRRMDRLGSFGVVPGTELTLKQKHPALVVEIEGTSLALDKEIADEIYVVVRV